MIGMNDESIVCVFSLSFVTVVCCWTALRIQGPFRVWRTSSQGGGMCSDSESAGGSSESRSMDSPTASPGTAINHSYSSHSPEAKKYTIDSSRVTSVHIIVMINRPVMLSGAYLPRTLSVAYSNIVFMLALRRLASVSCKTVRLFFWLNNVKMFTKIQKNVYCFYE